MSQERTVDVIDHARKFHSLLGDYYQGLSAVADRERVKILLDYLSACEKRHAQALADYEESAPHEVADTWFKWGADKAMENSLQLADLQPGMEVEAVLQEALRLDQCLCDLYQEIIERAHTGKIREVFSNLLETNRQEMKDLSRDFGHLMDW